MFNYPNDMNDIYKNIEEYNPNKKRKILIVFDDTIADILSNKKLDPIVTKLFISGRELNISLVFFCFFCTILFNCTKIYWTKFCAPFFIKISNN